MRAQDMFWKRAGRAGSKSNVGTHLDDASRFWVFGLLEEEDLKHVDKNHYIFNVKNEQKLEFFSILTSSKWIPKEKRVWWKMAASTTVGLKKYCCFFFFLVYSIEKKSFFCSGLRLVKPMMSREDPKRQTYCTVMLKWLTLLEAWEHS